MTAIILTLLLAIDPGAPALVREVGLPCQRAVTVEFFKLVSGGKATIADVRRLSELDHDGEVEEELQRCVLFPKEMEAILCKEGGATRKCALFPTYTEEEEAAKPDDLVLPPVQDAVVFERTARLDKETGSELAAFLLSRWPAAFGQPVSPKATSGPTRDTSYPTGISYQAKTRAGLVTLSFNRDECDLKGIELPDGTIPMAKLDCFWRQRARKNPAASPPPAPAGQSPAKPATPLAR